LQLVEIKSDWRFEGIWGRRILSCHFLLLLLVECFVSRSPATLRLIVFIKIYSVLHWFPLYVIKFLRLDNVLQPTLIPKLLELLQQEQFMRLQLLNPRIQWRSLLKHLIVPGVHLLSVKLHISHLFDSLSFLNLQFLNTFICPLQLRLHGEIGCLGDHCQPYFTVDF